MKRRERIHDEIEATYFAFERDGRSFLQIDTLRRSTRQLPSKQSQTLQFDRSGALALYKIFKQEFGFE